MMLHTARVPEPRRDQVRTERTRTVHSWVNTKDGPKQMQREEQVYQYDLYWHALGKTGNQRTRRPYHRGAAVPANGRKVPVR